MSQGKLQRQPSTGHISRDPSNGALRRNTATNSTCCCCKCQTEGLTIPSCTCTPNAWTISLTGTTTCAQFNNGGMSGVTGSTGYVSWADGASGDGTYCVPLTMPGASQPQYSYSMDASGLLVAHGPITITSATLNVLVGTSGPPGEVSQCVQIYLDVVWRYLGVDSDAHFWVFGPGSGPFNPVCSSWLADCQTAFTVDNDQTSCEPDDLDQETASYGGTVAGTPCC